MKIKTKLYWDHELPEQTDITIQQWTTNIESDFKKLQQDFYKIKYDRMPASDALYVFGMMGIWLAILTYHVFM